MDFYFYVFNVLFSGLTLKSQIKSFFLHRIFLDSPSSNHLFHFTCTSQIIFIAFYFAFFFYYFCLIWFPLLTCKLPQGKIHREFFSCIFRIYAIIFFEKERAWEWEQWRGRERGRKRILNRLYAQHGAWHRSWAHHHELVSWAEIKSQKLNQLSHPGALSICYKFLNIEIH